jgi:hypothetical protein
MPNQSLQQTAAARWAFRSLLSRSAAADCTLSATAQIAPFDTLDDTRAWNMCYVMGCRATPQFRALAGSIARARTLTK